MFIYLFFKKNPWLHAYMVGTNPNVINHALNLDPKVLVIQWKRRNLNAEKYATLRYEVKISRVFYLRSFPPKLGCKPSAHKEI